MNAGYNSMPLLRSSVAQITLKIILVQLLQDLSEDVSVSTLQKVAKL
jgi:hypothetical protein